MTNILDRAERRASSIALFRVKEHLLILQKGEVRGMVPFIWTGGEKRLFGRWRRGKECAKQRTKVPFTKEMVELTVGVGHPIWCQEPFLTNHLRISVDGAML